MGRAGFPEPVLYHRWIFSNDHANADGPLLGSAWLARQTCDAPSDQVTIESRGQDILTINANNETLDRYTLKGLIWGRETLWFDTHQNLIAEVSVDAEFDHFEAIREDHEGALATFVGRAGADNMAALADLAKGISGSPAETLGIPIVAGTDQTVPGYSLHREIELYTQTGFTP